MSRYLLLAALCGLLLPVTAAAADGLRPTADLRVRQEILEGVLHFADPSDANWLRVRSRAGLRFDDGPFGLELRLANEHRRHLNPSRNFDWDETIVDRALVHLEPAAGTTVTLGRQDIIWPGGLLMLEARPLDGSRAIFHNALRVRHGRFDLVLIRNLKRDPWVLIDDENAPVRDMDEFGLALRVRAVGLSWSAIYKEESDPDLVLEDLATGTFGARYARELSGGTKWEAEAAVQFQRRETGAGDVDATALALQANYCEPVGRGAVFETGGFLYAGRGEDGLRGFRTPWGRWPRWSELYIYTLIGENSRGRVNVAAWENIAAPRLQVRAPLGAGLDGRFNLTYLLAPDPDFEPHGLLTQAELKAALGDGLSAHLLWERLDPGSFHDGGNGLPPLTETVHFLRWQVSWSL